jgi:lauroyl/myristoyl acyltransferase
MTLASRATSAAQDVAIAIIYGICALIMAIPVAVAAALVAGGARTARRELRRDSAPHDPS